jgi:hypothetical protein
MEKALGQFDSIFTSQFPNHKSFYLYFFFLAEPVCCFHVTLDYRISFCIRGSNHNIFVIKTFWAVMNLVFSNLGNRPKLVNISLLCWMLCPSFFINTFVYLTSNGKLLSKLSNLVCHFLSTRSVISFWLIFTYVFIYFEPFIDMFRSVDKPLVVLDCSGRATICCSSFTSSRQAVDCF